MGTPMDIHNAFVAGDLSALRCAVDDPDAIPNGRMPQAIGPCLTYAIYHSPFPFIRELLELGADANGPADDGFTPLIAALGMMRGADGSPARPDALDVVRLLLAHGADPNLRGINDFTPLHMAVGVNSPEAVVALLEAGADPDLPTRIDEHETAEEMAVAAGLPLIAELLRTRGRPPRKRLRSGLFLLLDLPGDGEPVRRQARYAVRTRWRLADGTFVRRDVPDTATNRLEDNGTTLVTEIFMNRGSLMAGVFYGLDGMRIGGTRHLEIAPFLAYGDRGIPGEIPPGATLIAEITVLDAR